jgi:dTDP-4-amino-4,6-dideoxygalactose transaminase
LVANPILLNDFQRQWDDVRVDALRVFDAVGRSGWYILGDRVRGFEEALGAFWGIPHAVGVASGLDAIELALRAAGMQPGDRVLTTPLSAFATTLAIVRSGGIPVFCDTTEVGLIDLNDAREALRAMPGIRFFVPVHLYGFPLDRTALRDLIVEFQLICIEDCAQSIGAMDAGRPTGQVGVATATSFYPTKNLGAMGDGGAVLTGDPELAARIRRLRDYGQEAKYRHSEIGWNSRLDEVQAALLAEVFLPRLAKWTERRREIAARYLAEWPSSIIRPLTGREGSCWHLFPVRVPADRKKELMAWFREKGIATGEHYPVLIPEQEALARAGSVCFGALTQATRLAREELSLPIHPYLMETEVNAVLSAIANWPGAGASR